MYAGLSLFSSWNSASNLKIPLQITWTQTLYHTIQKCIIVSETFLQTIYNIIYMHIVICYFSYFYNQYWNILITGVWLQKLFVRMSVSALITSDLLLTFAAAWNPTVCVFHKWFLKVLKCRHLALGVSERSTCVSELSASAPVCCTSREFSYDVSSAYGRYVVVSYHSQLNMLIFAWSQTEDRPGVWLQTGIHISIYPQFSIYWILQGHYISIYGRLLLPQNKKNKI